MALSSDNFFRPTRLSTSPTSEGPTRRMDIKMYKATSRTPATTHTKIEILGNTVGTPICNQYSAQSCACVSFVVKPWQPHIRSAFSLRSGAAQTKNEVADDCEDRIARLAEFPDRAVVRPAGKNPVFRRISHAAGAHQETPRRLSSREGVL